MNKIQRTLITRAAMCKNPLVTHGCAPESFSRAIRCAGKREHTALIELIEMGHVEIVKEDDYDDRTETFYKLVEKEQG